MNLLKITPSKDKVDKSRNNLDDALFHYLVPLHGKIFDLILTLLGFFCHIIYGGFHV